jgi:hypothetical protein
VTAFANARAGMRAQAGAEIVGAAGACTLLRFNPQTDATGRKTGSYTSLLASGATEKVWIQPLAGDSDIQAQGLNSETTHLAYQKWSGTALVAKDRILPSGQTFAYDVIRAQVYETHRRAELKQVMRT